MTSLSPFVSLIHQILLPLRSAEATIEFSAYVNGPPGVTSSRRLLHIESTSPVEESLSHILSTLTSQEELGINSRCRVGTQILHIPMIDMVGKAPLTDIEPKLMRMGAQWRVRPVIFDSGRSYHCYFPILIPTDEWMNYLGSLLLCTPPVSDEALLPIDVRWVGHSLRNRFSCLRWTAQTPKYLRHPAPLTGAKYAAGVSLAL